MRANCSRCSLKKSNWTKSKGSYSLLGIKREKMWKNYKICFFRANRLFFESVRANHSYRSFLKSDRSDLLTFALFKRETRAICSPSLLFKEWWERIAYGRSLKRAILSKWAKREKGNFKPCWNGVETAKSSSTEYTKSKPSKVIKLLY